MGDVPPGLYEHLVTDRLAADLAATTPDLIQLGTLDPADAHETLTRHIPELAGPALPRPAPPARADPQEPLPRHIAELAGRALRAAGGGDATAISRQVELANRIVAAIGDLAPDMADKDDAVVEPARTLLAIAL